MLWTVYSFPSKVLRLSMEWSDYGRVASTVAFVMICAAVTVALLEFLWSNVPWESIRSFLSILVCYSTGSTALHADHNYLDPWGSSFPVALYTLVLVQD